MYIFYERWVHHALNFSFIPPSCISVVHSIHSTISKRSLKFALNYYLCTIDANGIHRGRNSVCFSEWIHTCIRYGAIHIPYSKFPTLTHIFHTNRAYNKQSSKLNHSHSWIIIIWHMWKVCTYEYILLYKFHWQRRTSNHRTWAIKSIITIDQQFKFSVKLIYYFISIVVSINNFKNSNTCGGGTRMGEILPASSQWKYWMKFSVICP